MQIRNVQRPRCPIKEVYKGQPTKVYRSRGNTPRSPVVLGTLIPTTARRQPTGPLGAANNPLTPDSLVVLGTLIPTTALRQPTSPLAEDAPHPSFRSESSPPHIPTDPTWVQNTARRVPIHKVAFRKKICMGKSPRRLTKRPFCSGKCHLRIPT